MASSRFSASTRYTLLEANFNSSTGSRTSSRRRPGSICAGSRRRSNSPGARGWEEKANEYLPFALGLPGPLPLVGFDACDRPAGAHWKLAGIGAFDADPRRPLAWVDDAHDEACTAWASGRSGPTLLVTTEPAVGITDAHVAVLRDWAGERTSIRPGEDSAESFDAPCQLDA